MRACHNGSELDLAYNDVISFNNKNRVSGSFLGFHGNKICVICIIF